MRYLIPFILVLSTISCEKIIPLDAEYTDPDIVINCAFNPDSSWVVHLSTSLNILDNGDFKGLEGATVNITDTDGNNFPLVEDGQGIYSSWAVPDPNMPYTIHVSAPNLESVTATDKVPNLGTTGLIDTVRITSFSQEFMEVSFYINDPADDNYYVIEFTVLDTMFNDDNEFNAYFTLRSADYENYEPDGYMSRAFLRDDAFNGQHYETSILVPVYHFDNFTSSELNLVVNTCSEEAYKYLTSYDRYLGTVGNPFAQPAQVYSNVNNGLGIFAGYKARRIPVKN